MKKFTCSLRRLGTVAALILCTGAAQQVLAQDDDPGSGGPTPSPTPVPLDGGASLLLAGGVAYGLRKLQQRRFK